MKLLEILSMNILSECIYMHMHEILDLVSQSLAFMKYFFPNHQAKTVRLRERNRMQVSCTKCGVIVASSYLKQNMARLNGICVPHMRGVNEGGGEPTKYVVSLPRILQSVICPVLG